MRQNLDKMSITMLTALEALYLTGKTTTAAEKLGVAQPSMSVYLKQLRELTGDELFVRTSRGLEPTDFCHDYYRGVTEILGALEVLGAKRNTVFDPATMPAAFSVAVQFIKGRMLFEELSVRLTRQFPQVRVDMINLSEKEALRHIGDGTADLYLGLVSEKLEKHFTVAKLLKTELVVLCSANSPFFKKGRLTKAEYLDTPHIKASASFDPSILDAKFKRMGLLQKRLVSVPDIWAEIALLRDTDYLLVIDRGDVDFIGEGDHFRVLKTDFEIPQFDFYAVWHARKTTDPAHKWYRDYMLKRCSARPVAIKPKNT